MIDLRERLIALARDARINVFPGTATINSKEALAIAAARLALDEAAQTCICHGMKPTATQADRRLCAATLIRALAAALGDGSAPST